MEYLYNENIIHRDIKPANILIKDGLYKLCDFGLVKDLSTNARSMEATSTKTLAGTFKYMSPQMRITYHSTAPTHYSAKTDAWSIGMVILECIIGYKEDQHVLQDEVKDIKKYESNVIVRDIVRHLLVKEEQERRYLHDPFIRETLTILLEAEKKQKELEASQPHQQNQKRKATVSSNDDTSSKEIRIHRGPRTQEGS